MKRLLILLVLVFPIGVLSQTILRNSLTTNDLSTNLVWTPGGMRMRISGASPSYEFWNTSGGADLKRYGLVNSGGQLRFEWTDDSGGSSLLLGTFSSDGTFSPLTLTLSGQTNRLTMAGGVLLYDGVPIVSTAGNPVNNFWSTNNFFVSGKGNTLIVTQTLTLNYVKTNLLVTDASGNVTNAVYGTGISWDPTTRTISSTASGGLGTSGSAYSIIGGAPIATNNWVSLSNAYVVAKAATPHGAALSFNNRYTIFLLPGIYDGGSQTFTLDTEFIDLVGLSENTGTQTFLEWAAMPSNIPIYGDTLIKSSATTINVNNASGTHDITIANLALLTSGSGSALTTTQGGFNSRFKVFNALLDGPNSSESMPWDKYFNGTWIDVRCFRARAFGRSVSVPLDHAGIFIRCKGGNMLAGEGAATTISGTVIDCEAGDGSFGRNGDTISGTLLRCRYNTLADAAGTGMFGGSTGTIMAAAILEDCAANPAVAAFGGSMSGTLISCSGKQPVWTTVGIVSKIIGCNFPGWDGPYPMNTADSTAIANTTNETSFSLTKTINVGDWKIGRAFSWSAWGKLNTDVSTPGTATVAFKLGANTVDASTPLTLIGGITNKGWRASGLFVCRTTGANGTVSGQMDLNFDTSAYIGSAIIAANGVTTNAMNAASTAQITWTWGTAAVANSVVLENFYVNPL